MPEYREHIENQAIGKLHRQEGSFTRSAWIYRWCGWLCVWGAATLASLAALFGSGISTNKHPEYAAWCGFIAAALTGINQTVKFEVWAEAYYKSHIALETVLLSYELGQATIVDVEEAWKQAQSGLPGINKVRMAPREPVADVDKAAKKPDQPPPEPAPA
jgi:hypothetical protein